MTLLAAMVLVPAFVAFGLAPLLVNLWGRRLPESHETRRSVHVPATPHEVFTLLADVRAIPRWRKTVRRVTILGTEPRLRFREHGAQGALELEIESSRSPDRLVVRAIPARPMAFEGSWTYELEPEADGTRATLTERGRIGHPIARVFAVHALGRATHGVRTLAALAHHFRR